MDNFRVQRLYELKAIGSEVATFDDNDKHAWEYGVYAANTTVAIVDGEATLNVTGMEQLVLSLGDVTKGNYKLKFDAKITGGYAAIVQVVTGLKVNNKTGKASWDDLTTLYNSSGKSLSDFAKKTGDTYELNLLFDADYESVGFILINNIANQVCGISLDNISFVALDYSQQQTIQAFDSVLLASASWSAKPGLGYMANAHVDYGGTFTGKIVDGAYQFGTATTYSRVNLGWFEAGTYTFTFDAKVTDATNYNGSLRLFVCQDNNGSLEQVAAEGQTVATTFSGEWATYSVTFTITEARFIKLGVVRNAMNGTVCLDNFTAQKTA
jgi:hypothetical protein